MIFDPTIPPFIAFELLIPIRATWSSFFGRQKRSFAHMPEKKVLMMIMMVAMIIMMMIMVILMIIMTIMTKKHTITVKFEKNIAFLT